MEKWYKNKRLTREEAVRVQYETMLISMIIEEHALIFIKANVTQANFPPLKERLEAIALYLNSLPGNMYFEANELTKEAKLYSLKKSANGEMEKDKKNLEEEFFAELDKARGRGF